jgi:lipoprotein-anchoring transpeptidase ErfK/SrfK
MSIHTKIRRAMAPALMLLIGAMATTAFAKTNNGERALQNTTLIAEAEQLLANLGYAIDNADGKLDFNSRHAIMAFQKVEGLKRTGILTAAVLEKMRSASTPSAKYNGPAHVEVDITRQVLFMVNDEGNVTLIVPISSGSGEKYWDKTRNRYEVASTPRGEFKFNRKVNGNRKAALGTLYYPSYFKEGWAVHGSNSIPPKAASHGCVRVPRGMDKKLFGMMPIGMKIYIFD